LNGGVVIGAGRFRLINSVVAANGGVGALGAAVELVGSDDALILYSTIVGNQSSDVDSLECSNTVAEIRNSIVSGAQSSSISSACDTNDVSFVNSLVDSESFATGSNALVGATNPDWFADFQGGDFRLSAMAPMYWATVAQWMTGDPEHDLDGTPRPQDEPGYPGADQPE
jgi:hypothetical protein